MIPLLKYIARILSQPNTSRSSSPKPNQITNTNTNLRDYYENQLNNFQNNYFNNKKDSSDSEANVSDLDINEYLYEGGEKESITYTIINESPKHQQDFNRIPILKFVLLNNQTQQDTTLINIINNNIRTQTPPMINEDEGEIHSYLQYQNNKNDIAVDNFVTAAGKGTKLNSKIYYEMMKNREQIFSRRLQSASSAMSDKIDYYFRTIEDLLDRPYTTRMKTAGKASIKNEII